MSALLLENGRTPAAYVGDVNSLPWNFISFPRKPSYSAFSPLNFPTELSLFYYSLYL